MASRIVTVFGGSGFLGRHVVRALCRKGWRVRVACRRPHLAGDAKLAGDVGQVQLVQANVRNRNSIKRALENAEAVVNLVGIMPERGPQSFQGTHVLGATNIAQLAAEAGISSFVYVSAIGAEKDSKSNYFRTKAEAEAATREAVPTATILRPSIIFGPEDGFFTRFAVMARFSPVLPLIGGGNTRFQPVYVGDVAEAIARSVDGAVPGGQVYELGGPRVMTFRECLEEMLEVIDRKRILAPVPWWMARIQGSLLGLLPNPLLTSDQVTLLEADNVVSDEAEKAGRTLAAFGVRPQATAAILPTYLWRYRAAGQFTHKSEA